MTLGSISFTVETVLVSGLTTLGQAAGNDEGLKVKVIEEQDEVGKSNHSFVRGRKLEGLFWQLRVV